MRNIQAIVLAAGRSTRFKTGKSKLLEFICGQEMILYVTKLLEHLHIPITMVVGFQKEDLMKIITEGTGASVTFVHQEEQRGTGHAVQCTRSSWSADSLLIMNGDVPLVPADVITALYEEHQKTKAAISFVTTHLPEPSDSYGRIVEDGEKIAIVEARDFKGDPQDHCCVNAGIYLIRRSFIESYIDSLVEQPNKEFYLTDLVKIACDQNRVVTQVAAAFDDVRGVNDFKELWAVEHIQRSRLVSYWMAHGVRFCNAQTVHLDCAVSIGAGTEVGSGVHLYAGTIIGDNCTIAPFSIIKNSVIADHVTVHPYSMVVDSRLESGSQVGPFAHIREKSVISSQAVIGNFVEVKKSLIGSHTKAKHLSYVGDAVVGQHVNIGAGTITCNHNGVSKNVTTIQDGAYIGTNNSLVAPVTIGRESYTAAGSVITKDVPPQALAIARAQQVNKEGYAIKLRKRASTGKENETPFVAAKKHTEPPL